MFQPLDGPAVYGAKSVSTATELKVGASALEERKIVQFQPTDGIIYYGYDSSVTTSNGIKVFSGQLIIIEASDSLPIYLIAHTGTVNVRIAEVS